MTIYIIFAMTNDCKISIRAQWEKEHALNEAKNCIGPGGRNTLCSVFKAEVDEEDTERVFNRPSEPAIMAAKNLTLIAQFRFNVESTLFESVS